MIEELIKEFQEIKDKKQDLNKQLKKLNEEEAYIETTLIEALQAEGLQKASSDLATASLSHKSYPAIKDWDKALAFIVNGHRELLNKKINAAAYRELEEAGIEVPGVKSFDKATLNFKRKG